MLNKKYWFAKFRTTKKYIGFLVVQLLLSLAVAIIGFTNQSHFRSKYTISLEILIAVCIALDLVVRFTTERQFFKSKGNILDLLVFFSLIAIIVYVSVSKPKENDLFLESDDIILIVIIIVRLAIMIKNSHDSQHMQKQLKEIDFNDPKTSGGHQTVQNGMDAPGSLVFRNKIMEMVGKGQENSMAVQKLNQEV